MTNSGSFTTREARFVDEYLVDFNATQAAIRAGYSPHTARQIGSLNLSKVDIHAAIGAATRETARRNEYDVDNFVNDLMERVNADMADIFDSNSRLLPIQEWPSVWRRGMVTAFKVRRSAADEGSSMQSYSLRFADHTKLLELLGRQVGAFR